MNVREFLNDQHVDFGAARHQTTFSAQRLAACLDVPGDNVAKTVVLNADGNYFVAVLQASHFVDIPKARTALDAEGVKLVLEDELATLFPDCELGAVPPFGSQYGMRTLVDEPLTHDEYIVFEGNSHDEAISMSYSDYEKLEHPKVAAFSRHF